MCEFGILSTHACARLILVNLMVGVVLGHLAITSMLLATFDFALGVGVLLVLVFHVELSEIHGMGWRKLSDFDVCWFDDKPCNMLVSHDGRRSCLLRSGKGVLLCACVRIRFKGMDSVREQGFGMTIREKLERQGLIGLIEKKQRQREARQ